MMKKKINQNLIKTCTLISGFIILSGCSSLEKKEPAQESLVSLQKQRIKNLQRELQKRDRLISDLKAREWSQKPTKVDEKLAFHTLKNLYKDKRWAAALKESSRLKEKYSDSIRLRTYRYKIFRRLGLQSQASQEQVAIKKIIARKKSQRRESL